MALLTDDPVWAAEAVPALRARGLDAYVGPLDTLPESPLLEDCDVVMLKPQMISGACWRACLRLGGRVSSLLVLLHTPERFNDYVVALDLGADECLSPELEFEEITARLRALARRKQLWTKAGGVTGAYHFDGWRFTPTRAELRAPNGEVVILPRNDFRLLALLVEDPGRAFSANELSQHLEPLQASRIDWRIRVHRLRTRLLKTGSQADWLQTVPGAGYAVAADVRRQAFGEGSLATARDPSPNAPPRPGGHSDRAVAA